MAEKSKYQNIDAVDAALDAGVAAAASVAELAPKVAQISSETTTDKTEEIRFEKNDGTLIGKIDETGADFQSIRIGGRNVEVSPLSLGKYAYGGYFTNGNLIQSDNFNCLMIPLSTGKYIIDFFCPTSDFDSVTIKCYKQDKKTEMTNSFVSAGNVGMNEDGYLYILHFFNLNKMEKYSLEYYNDFFIKKVSSLTTHKILWIGTSIPTGGGVMSLSYPEWVCRNLGVTLEKHAIGESRITDGIVKTLSDTILEKTSKYADQTGTDERGMQKPSTYFSYENLIMPFVDKCDIMIFEHGHNDGAVISSNYSIKTKDEDINWASTDRTTYIGAFNYIYQEVLSKNPNIRVFITSSCLEKSSTQNDAPNNGFYGSVVTHINKLIADHYGLPYLDIAGELGWPKNIPMPNTSTFLSEYNTEYGTNYVPYWTDQAGNISIYQYFCPDCVHPHSDKRDWDGFTPKGLAIPKVIECFTRLLKQYL